MSVETPAGHASPSMSPVEKAAGNVAYAIGGNSNSGSTPFGDYYGVSFVAGCVPALMVVAWAILRRPRVKLPKS